MENRRLLLAAFLSAAVLIVWQALFYSPPVAPPPPEPAAEVPAEVPAGAAGPGAVGTGAAPGDAEPAGEVQAEAPPAELSFGGETIAADEEKRVVLTRDGMRVELTNRGAQLVSVGLAGERDTAGQPIELVRRRGSDPYPLSVVVEGERSHRLNRALFAWDEGVDDDGDPYVRFRHASELGAAEKVFSLTGEGLLEVTVRLPSRERWGVVMGPGVRNPTEKELESRFTLRQASFRRGEEAEELAAGSQEEEIVIGGTGLRWVALEDTYFITAILPREGLREVVVRPVEQRREVEEGEPRFVPAGSELAEETHDEQLLLLQAEGAELRFLAFLGPKQYERLAALPYGLEETVRWGMFGPLVKPLYHGLDWIHERVVANYGWAIVLVTVIIRILFFPLTWKSQESMTRMQELNPKIQAIRQKYRPKLKDKQGRPNLDAQRQMNEEVMGVYRSAGVNPASGCLPILLQMPVFFAFYRLLSTAVELRHAPWIAWIHDLSQPDPYFVLPLLMGVTSFVMQRMTPAAPDPLQRRLMELMPIMFTFFAFAFPSGLVLYWLTNNLLSMGQQALLVRSRKRRELAKRAEGGA